jgi:hypothetical protein
MPAGANGNVKGHLIEAFAERVGVVERLALKGLRRVVGF